MRGSGDYFSSLRAPCECCLCMLLLFVEEAEAVAEAVAEADEAVAEAVAAQCS